MHEKILIIDFGSQYTQLIARRVRELRVFSEIIPPSKLTPASVTASVKGIILSGSPFSVDDQGAPGFAIGELSGVVPILGICYGAQWMARHAGGEVVSSAVREYGKANLSGISSSDELFRGITDGTQVWMSHGDTIMSLPPGYQVIAGTGTVRIAAYRKNGAANPIYGIQFHPEVTHTADGKRLLENFLALCGCKGDWTPAAFIHETVDELRSTIGKGKAVLGLSGGVDSTVAAILLHKAIGKNLFCLFIDNGLLRKNEFTSVLDSYQHLGLNVTGTDDSSDFLRSLKGVTDPEAKRKAIGRTFIEVFDREAHSLTGIDWLVQGTIYPDVIESTSVHGPSATIKSHHNVGGLPEKMKLKVVEPLRYLFKDEVRQVGAELGIPGSILARHPFPGPGLAVRIPGEITGPKLAVLREADDIFISALHEDGLYDQVWQAFAILLPVQTVGVMGDSRTYEFTCALRAVTSVDGMTADWARLPSDFLAKVSSRIINSVKGINRVVYDISSKPPATIEWE